MSRRDRRTPSTPAEVARVRTLLEARMPWLPGFPDPAWPGPGVRWIPARAATPPIALEGRQLSRATRASRELLRDHPLALSRVVGDAEAWSARTHAMIELLKPAVHGRGPVPLSLFARDVQDPALVAPSIAAEGRAAAADRPDLAPIVGALSWLTAGDRKRARKALRIVDGWREPLAQLLAQRDLPLALCLWQLAEEEGPQRIEPLLALIVDPRAQLLTTNPEPYLVEFASVITRHAPLPEPLQPGPDDVTLSTAAVKLVRLLLGWDRKRRRRALSLLTLVRPDDTLDRWVRFWQGHDQVRREVRRKLARRPRHARARWYKEVAAPIEDLRRKIPPLVDPGAVLATIDRLSEPAHADWFPAARDILTLLPDQLRGRPVRLAFAEQWFRVLHQGDPIPPRRLVELFKRVRSYFRRYGVDERTLRPWNRVLEVSSGTPWMWAIDDELLDTLERPAEWGFFFEALGQLRDARKLPPADLLARLAVRSRNPALTVDAATALIAAGHDDAYINGEELSMALRVSQGDAELFAAIIAAVIEAEGDERESVRPVLTRMTELFEAAGALPELGRLLRGSARDVLDATVALSLAQRTGCSLDELAPPSPARRLPRFAARLPERFRRAARVLAGAHPQARTVARKILGKDLPDPDDLAAELATVEQRLADAPPDRAAALRRHANSVRKRIAQPRTVSPARLARLSGKLDEAAGRALLDGWRRRIDEQLTDSLCRLLGADELQPWMRTRTTERIIDGALALRGASRALALRMLRLRAGPPPWDLRDEPENRAFLDGLRKLGVDPTPWLDGITLERRAGDRRITLTLTEDPLDIFWMGAHFGTCLSPGAMNYFSVFTNAADVNKRVLYARVADGAVAGRCLLALTTGGSILTFHPYCHYGEIDFKAMVSDFAHNLADAMGTRVVPRGDVPTLVARDWYDDGPVDLTGALDALADGSPLRAGLASVAPEALVGHLETELGAPLDDYTLMQVVTLPEMAQRPALVLPLASRLERARALPVQTRVHAGWLARRAGDLEAARRIAGDELEPYLVGLWKQGYDHGNAADLLLAIAPHRVLRGLRRTRARGVRSFLDETQPYRLFLAARACAALHRPAQARRLYQRIVDDAHNDFDLAAAQAGLQRLASM